MMGNAAGAAASLCEETSVSDPFHLDMDPDPRIRFVK